MIRLSLYLWPVSFDEMLSMTARQISINDILCNYAMVFDFCKFFLSSKILSRKIYYVDILLKINMQSSMLTFFISYSRINKHQASIVDINEIFNKLIQKKCWGELFQADTVTMDAFHCRPHFSRPWTAFQSPIPKLGEAKYCTGQ